MHALVALVVIGVTAPSGHSLSELGQDLPVPYSNAVACTQFRARPGKFEIKNLKRLHAGSTGTITGPVACMASPGLACDMHACTQCIQHRWGIGNLAAIGSDGRNHKQHVPAQGRPGPGGRPGQQPELGGENQAQRSPAPRLPR
jgi:hypothetical protein